MTKAPSACALLVLAVIGSFFVYIADIDGHRRIFCRQISVFLWEALPSVIALAFGLTHTNYKHFNTLCQH